MERISDRLKALVAHQQELRPQGTGTTPELLDA